MPALHIYTKNTDGHAWALLLWAEHAGSAVYEVYTDRHGCCCVRHSKPTRHNTIIDTCMGEAHMRPLQMHLLLLPMLRTHVCTHPTDALPSSALLVPGQCDKQILSLIWLSHCPGISKDTAGDGHSLAPLRHASCPRMLLTIHPTAT